MISLEEFSRVCVGLLTVISFFVAMLLLLGSTPWPLIVMYWVVLAAKNLCDGFKDC